MQMDLEPFSHKCIPRSCPCIWTRDCIFMFGVKQECQSVSQSTCSSSSLSFVRVPSATNAVKKTNSSDLSIKRSNLSAEIGMLFSYTRYVR
mmetsp:Transcript_7330/g.17875  ORF Transcript_7330/g.17875 Transcript_7330/m.17875 type:complete len:91 (+) Transcript_7330:91-363(+)